MFRESLVASKNSAPYLFKFGLVCFINVSLSLEIMLLDNSVTCTGDFTRLGQASVITSFQQFKVRM